ncbi:MAG: IPTL-CTERM sorting domain-containing protein [Gallionellaceae bacterium]
MKSKYSILLKAILFVAFVFSASSAYATLYVEINSCDVGLNNCTVTWSGGTAGNTNLFCVSGYACTGEPPSGTISYPMHGQIQLDVINSGGANYVYIQPPSNCGSPSACDAINAVGGDAAVGTPGGGGGPAPVPTLSKWDMLLLSSLLALGAIFALRRQRQ